MAQTKLLSAVTQTEESKFDLQLEGQPNKTTSDKLADNKLHACLIIK